eukprot:CAMPEP_0167752026 /NCGR_PEP_ID=MMETSP0110_2-20121227/6904_1 /TAXON_ID=629695 /ORGANISM="Gymnochlora sp., Strain CCMP2014" /LENGTH=102 /DNA_ID=CAMNT_0007637585 /DNA_START=111 /DNA_END=419 /DNA_ORIENTATION=+
MAASCFAVMVLFVTFASVFYASAGSQQGQLGISAIAANRMLSPVFRTPAFVQSRDVTAFGRGDKRTKRGKRFAKSYGNCRQRKGKPAKVYYPSPPDSPNSPE